MKPCLNPQICGVQSHRPETICYAERAARVASGQTVSQTESLGNPISHLLQSRPADQRNVDELNEQLSKGADMVERLSNGELLYDFEKLEIEEHVELINYMKQTDDYSPQSGNKNDFIHYQYSKQSPDMGPDEVYGVGAHEVELNGRVYLVGVIYHNEFEEVPTGGQELNRLSMKIGTPNDREEIINWVNERSTRDKQEQIWYS